ncbi:MAG: aldose 1-epimerase family protein [Lachnospiraceae bacterium]|nr:aldose 1-epimerase family protein [Lachnospiraceae bacterium]
MKYVLENEYLTVTFQSLGGALSSIQNKEGLEYLWQGDKTYWGGQAPVLFPICGSLKNDRAKIGTNQVTEMPRHGIVRKKEFSCIEQDSDSILFCIESDEEAYQQFPYHFKLGIRYTLIKNTIRTKYIVENQGKEKMPFFIGGHPGFNCPLFPEESYEDYWLEFPVQETCSVPNPITETGLIDMQHRTEFLKKQEKLRLSHDLFTKDAVILDEIKSRSVKLVSSNHDRSVELEFPDFPYLILWSSANKGPFVALEPWLGLSTCSDESDVFEQKRNVQIVNSKETKTYYFDIKIF